MLASLDSRLRRRPLHARLVAFAATVVAVLAAAPVADAQTEPAFNRSVLSGLTGAKTLSQPTSLQWGPDGRLYVAEMTGNIWAYTVSRTGTSAYTVTAAEKITGIAEIPNHSDLGEPNPTYPLNYPIDELQGQPVTGRLLTGIDVEEDPDTGQPVIYAVSADPRIVGGGADSTDTGVDTNSGVLSRLTKTGSGWVRKDLVRGLSRSMENHTANGSDLSPDGRYLYITQGGNTNKGAPSTYFVNLPEYALSSAIVSVDLQDSRVEAGYDLPTLDDPARDGTNDSGDPFGGNKGNNQARLEVGSPVQVYAPGFRNAYDVVVTSAGDMYVTDNGGNAPWGAWPDPDTCTNQIEDGGLTDSDGLHRVYEGYYGGHPNPTRGNTTDNRWNGQSPVDAALEDPRECVFEGTTNNPWPALAQSTRNPAGFNDYLYSVGSSMNGITEYTSNVFGGTMKGDLLMVAQANYLKRFQVAPTDAYKGNLIGSVGITHDPVTNAPLEPFPLDVTAVGDDGVAGNSHAFDGSIWVVDYGNQQILAFEPAVIADCDLSDPTADSDGDGFSNGDEAANGSGPCNPGDAPVDYDGDHVSNRSDPDDDNDGVPDVSDAFAIDPANGLEKHAPLNLNWDNTDTRSGLLGLGFTGLMTNGETDWLDQYDPENLTTGGAAGVVSMDAVPAGDAYGPNNDQLYGFQTGVNARPGGGKLQVTTRVLQPFGTFTPVDYQSTGTFIGTGDQDNYVKLTAAHIGDQAIQMVTEINGVASSKKVNVPLSTLHHVDLILKLDPTKHQVQGAYVLPDGTENPPVYDLGDPVTVPASWFTDPLKGLAVGILATSNDEVGSPTPFATGWDFLRIARTGDDAEPVTTPPGDATPPGNDTTPQPPADSTTPTTPAAPLQPSTPSTPTTPTKPVTGDIQPPEVKGLRLDATSLKALAKGAKSLKFKLTLPESAKVKVTIERDTTGRLAGKQCVTKTKSNASKKACAMTVTVPKMSLSTTVKGTKTLTLKGKSKLAAGKYKLLVKATDKAGNATESRVAFTVKQG